MADAMRMFFDVVEKAAESAVSVTRNVVEKGRTKIEKHSLERELAKAQRRLGMLSYTLHKSGEENRGLVKRYVEEIDDLYARIDSQVASRSSVVVTSRIHLEDEFSSSIQAEKVEVDSKPLTFEKPPKTPKKVSQVQKKTVPAEKSVADNKKNPTKSAKSAKTNTTTKKAVSSKKTTNKQVNTQKEAKEDATFRDGSSKESSEI